MSMTFEEWVARVDRVAKDKGGLKGLLKREMAKAGLVAEGTAKTLLTSRKRTRSGRLRSSIRHTVEERGGQLELVLEAGGGPERVQYARLQELGGTVRAKNARNLAIPISPAVLTPAGVSRYRSPRDVPEELSFMVSRNGHKLLVNKETGEPYYVLKKQVTVGAGHFLRDGIRAGRKAMDPLVRQAVTTAVGLD